MVPSTTDKVTTVDERDRVRTARSAEPVEPDAPTVTRPLSAVSMSAPVDASVRVVEVATPLTLSPKLPVAPEEWSACGSA